MLTKISRVVEPEARGGEGGAERKGMVRQARIVKLGSQGEIGFGGMEKEMFVRRIIQLGRASALTVVGEPNITS